MNLPTKITVARLGLTVIIILLLCVPFSAFGIHFPKYDVGGIIVELQYLISGVFFIIASVTDFLDGYIARKYNMVTDTGKILDAIADKVLVSPILILLAANGFIPVIVPVIYVTRDIVVDAIKMQAASKGKVVGAIKSGKYKTATMMVGITLVFFYNMPFAFIGNGIAIDYLFIFVATIMSIISGVQYYLVNKDFIFSEI